MFIGDEGMILQGRLKGYQRAKLRHVLDMLYTSAELASEIGITTRQIYRVYVPLGCPVLRSSGRLFISGYDFARWYEATYPRVSLASDEGFCLTCRKAVKVLKPEKWVSGRLSYLVFSCPSCGRQISRIVERV
jgi:predicted RNA-binding Zn-ribbon protein involved in translation (DUF1610 family)